MKRSAPMRRTEMKRGSKPMKRIGGIGKRRLKTSRELTAEAKANGHDFCELAPVLRDFEIDDSRCFGDLQNCHSTKCSARSGQAELDRETARGCSHHHEVMDSKTHAAQLWVVRTAIARRETR